jgi:hypothetical protein
VNVNEERTRDALEHLQGAALQLIAAFRAVLDVAEDLIRDGEPGATEDEPKPASRVTRIQVS